ncbi:MAG TPA: PepSY domain-containing protein [Pseudorhodoplanes sp.]|jgi:uncharacterized membrane protein YkoI|nr:PepSY domain-containing protein [Pseudorhodoplanes sp.]
MDLRFQAGLRAIALAAAVIVAPTAPAHARDHDDARRAVEAGEARPLTEILEMVKDKLPGEIVRVHLERQHDLWVYEFRVVGGQGRVFEVHVDARSGEIRRTREK